MKVGWCSEVLGGGSAHIVGTSGALVDKERADTSLVVLRHHLSLQLPVKAKLAVL